MQIRPYFHTITSSAPTSHTVSSSTHGVQHSRSKASLVIDTILIVPRHPGSTAQWLKIFHFHPSCDRNRANSFKVIQVHLGDSFTTAFDHQPLKSQVPSSTTQHRRSLRPTRSQPDQVNSFRRKKQDQFSLAARWRLYPVFSRLATSFLQGHPLSCWGLSCWGLATHGFVWLLKLRPHLLVMAGKKDLMFWKSVVDLHSAWVEVLPLLKHMLGLVSFNPAGRLWICHISFWNGPNTEPCCTLYLQDWHQKICMKKI